VTSGAGCGVLVVEDDADLRHMMVELLALHGSGRRLRPTGRRHWTCRAAMRRIRA
jgi:hypothetical protein